MCWCIHILKKKKKKEAEQMEEREPQMYLTKKRNSFFSLPAVAGTEHQDRQEREQFLQVTQPSSFSSCELSMKCFT